jgi:DNA-binding NarL/FixJ family response regulator
MLHGHPDLQVVGESSTGLDAIALCKSLLPDLVLLDLSLGTLNGMDLIQKMIKEQPKIRILVFSAFEEASYAVRALKAGASGFISKEQAADELLIAIRTVLQGKKYISAAVAQSLADWVQDSDLSPAHIDLTAREFQTVQLIASGLKTSEIGEKLCISVKTVSMYRHRVLLKLGLRNNAELIAYVIKNRLTLEQNISQESDKPE